MLLVAGTRAGDLDQAVSHGRRALEGDRKSLPSLLMGSKELATLLRERYPKEPEAVSYLDEVRARSALADPVCVLARTSPTRSTTYTGTRSTFMPGHDPARAPHMGAPDGRVRLRHLAPLPVVRHGRHLDA
ncbi:hypothetical protein Nm8I071_04170 [Nonomuraea sp. TT08I-71]|nr:hypothetical protein Nm8I071_04170 [Nonomuraea sp. TT08I-71]